MRTWKHILVGLSDLSKPNNSVITIEVFAPSHVGFRACAFNPTILLLRSKCLHRVMLGFGLAPSTQPTKIRNLLVGWVERFMRNPTILLLLEFLYNINNFQGE